MGCCKSDQTLYSTQVVCCLYLTIVSEVSLRAVSCLTSSLIYSGFLSCYQFIIGSWGTADSLEGQSQNNYRKSHK